MSRGTLNYYLRLSCTVSGYLLLSARSTTICYYRIWSVMIYYYLLWPMTKQKLEQKCDLSQSSNFWYFDRLLSGIVYYYVILSICYYMLSSFIMRYYQLSFGYDLLWFTIICYCMLVSAGSCYHLCFFLLVAATICYKLLIPYMFCHYRIISAIVRSPFGIIRRYLLVSAIFLHYILLSAIVC